MPKESYYFPHDYHARADEKTAALIASYGAHGYGLYWLLVEMMHEDSQCAIPYDDDKKLQRIAAQARIEYPLFRQMLEDCVHLFDLFVIEDGQLTSARVQRNKNKREQERMRKSEAGKKSARMRSLKKSMEETDRTENATHVEENPTAVAQNPTVVEHNATPFNKGKERKEKEKEVKEKSGSQPTPVCEAIAMQLMHQCAGLRPAQALEEAALLLQKAQKPGAGYIARWAQHIVLRPRMVVMKSPLGGEAAWTEEEYERQKGTTAYKFVKYED